MMGTATAPEPTETARAEAPANIAPPMTVTTGTPNADRVTQAAALNSGETAATEPKKPAKKVARKTPGTSGRPGSSLTR